MQRYKYNFIVDILNKKYTAIKCYMLTDAGLFRL